MWARLRTSKSKKDTEVMDARNNRKGLNINEEYNRAVRTKSFADCFTKCQFLKDKDDPSSTHSSISYPCNIDIPPSTLLEPGEETITSILESTKLVKNPKLKSLLHNYFHLSAEGSNICSHLLKNINLIQSHHQEIQQTLFNTNTISSTHSLEQKLVPELSSLMILNNPFPGPKNDEFKHIRQKYTSLLTHLQSNNKKVARKIKFIRRLNKASGICITLASGLITTAAIILAIHGFVALVMGPVLLFTLPMNSIKKKFKHIKEVVTRPRFLSKVGQQLNVAAKGTYVLNQDFGTMSRLVVRLHDEIEHNKEIIGLCLERKGEGVFKEEMVKELKKSYCGLKKCVEELEEHVYLCLVTINRARTLVLQEIAAYIESK